MSAVEFQGLCDAICRQAGIQAAAVQDYGDGTVALQLQFGDVNVMLAQYAANPSLVMALVNFGEPEPHEELACWLSLLDVNYHLLGAWPTSFGRSLGAGSAVLQRSFPLGRISASDLYLGLLQMTESALQWRAGGYHDAASAPVSAPPVWDSAAAGLA